MFSASHYSVAVAVSLLLFVSCSLGVSCLNGFWYYPDGAYGTAAPVCVKCRPHVEDFPPEKVHVVTCRSDSNDCIDVSAEPRKAHTTLPNWLGATRASRVLALDFFSPSTWGDTFYPFLFYSSATSMPVPEPASYGLPPLDPQSFWGVEASTGSAPIVRYRSLLEYYTVLHQCGISDMCSDSGECRPYAQQEALWGRSCASHGVCGPHGACFNSSCTDRAHGASAMVAAEIARCASNQSHMVRCSEGHYTHPPSAILFQAR